MTLFQIRLNTALLCLIDDLIPLHAGVDCLALNWGFSIYGNRNVTARVLDKFQLGELHSASLKRHQIALVDTRFLILCIELCKVLSPFTSVLIGIICQALDLFREGASY